MTTIRELAKLSGLSTATVMRALHDDKHILPETKEKIMQLAALYDYQIKPVHAASLNERLVGCIVPSVTSLIFSPLLKGVLESAFAASLRVVVLENDSSVTHTCKAMHVLHKQGVLGVIIASGHDHRIPASEALALWSDNIHIVAADGNPFVDGVVVDCVENDFEEPDWLSDTCMTWDTVLSRMLVADSVTTDTHCHVKYISGKQCRNTSYQQINFMMLSAPPTPLI